MSLTHRSRLQGLLRFIESFETDSLPEPAGDLEELFVEGGARAIHKWLHYFAPYERHLSHFRGSDFRFLEIGVLHGGSLEMWRRYFGKRATIFGIDIEPECVHRVDPPNCVMIGSQADRRFLQQVVSKMGGIDVVLDDGSHHAGDQMASFAALFPLLSEGGLYIIEDVHTSYWAGHYGGGYREAGTAVDLAKRIIDDMHGWYHFEAETTPAREWISALHVYDSMIFLEKKHKERPAFVNRPGAA